MDRSDTLRNQPTPLLTIVSPALVKLLQWLNKWLQMEVSWPSGYERRIQTLVFLISRVWVRIPSRNTCVLKQDT